MPNMSVRRVLCRGLLLALCKVIRGVLYRITAVLMEHLVNAGTCFHHVGQWWSTGYLYFCLLR